MPVLPHTAWFAQCALAEGQQREFVVLVVPYNIFRECAGRTVIP